METNELTALFGLMAAFPHESHHVSQHGNLIITIPLTDKQRDFFDAGRRMFEPAE